MSSYVVAPMTINHIVSGIYYACTYDRIYPSILRDQEHPNYFSDLWCESVNDAESLGHTLYEMNVNATMQRYPADTRDTLPGTYKNGRLADYRHAIPHNSSIYRHFEALDEYLYQCSEGNVTELPMFTTISRWRDAVACSIARMVIQEHNEIIKAAKEKHGR